MFQNIFDYKTDIKLVNCVHKDSEYYIDIAVVWNPLKVAAFLKELVASDVLDRTEDNCIALSYLGENPNKSVLYRLYFVHKHSRAYKVILEYSDSEKLHQFLKPKLDIFTNIIQKYYSDDKAMIELSNTQLKIDNSYAQKR
jgi:hypothetical protein